MRNSGHVYLTSAVNGLWSARCTGSSVVMGSASKKTAHASEQKRADVATRREAWFALQPDLDATRLAFLDETDATTKMARLRGRSRRGERCRASVPHGHSLPGSGLPSNREKGGLNETRSQKTVGDGRWPL